LAITAYHIEAYLSDSWQKVSNDFIVSLGLAQLTDNKGTLTELRVVATNSLG
jgi:hypothetical protein